MQFRKIGKDGKFGYKYGGMAGQRLHPDFKMKLLLKGGGGAIKGVIVINWRVWMHRTNVAGTADVWRLNQNGRLIIVEAYALEMG
jgi:hypothetical protein